MTQPLKDRPPGGARVTDYDLAFQRAYLRLLDAAEDPSADWKEAVKLIFGIDASLEPSRARTIYDTHLERARWMTAEGYRDLAGLAPRKS